MSQPQKNGDKQKKAYKTKAQRAQEEAKDKKPQVQSKKFKKKDKRKLATGYQGDIQRGGGKGKRKGFDPKQASQMVKEPPKMSTNITSSLSIKVAVDNTAVSASFLPTITWLLEKGVLAQLMQSGIAPPDVSTTLLSFVNFLLTGLQNIALGSEMTVTTLPDYINVLFEAMRPKQIPFKTGTINYSWSEGLSFVLGNVVPGPFSSFVFGNIVDNGTPTDLIEPIAPVPGNQTDYNLVVKFFGQEQTDTAMVPAMTKTVTTKDAAAFARQYVYNGVSITPTGGWFCDIENEVPFKCPMFAKFVQYGSGMDLRVSRYLDPSAGDSLYSMGMPLLADFSKQYYKNRYPPVFKCIDMNLIAGWLCAWAVLARETYLNANFATIDPAITQPFGFSQQDFYIVVRQALCAVFPTQKCVQFLAPMSFTDTGTNNGFVSLVTHFGTYGNPVFKDLNVPQMLQENIGCLKMRSFRPKTQYQVSRNVLNYVPVLGVYVSDVAPEWQFTVDGGTQSLFTPSGTPEISLVDGSSGTSYYNLNSSYYQDVMATWNQFVSLITQVTTANVSLGTDNGPLGLSLLCFTNYEESMTNTERHKIRMKKFGKCHVRNVPGVETKLVREKSKNGVDVKSVKEILERKPKIQVKGETSLPSASLSTLTYSQTTMVKGVTDEELSLLGKMILPVFRLDPEGADPTNIAMVATSSIEPYLKNNTTMDSNGTVSGRTVLEWLEDSAAQCVTGTAGASNATYPEMMKLLAQRGEAGTLGNIAGALLGALGQQQLGSLATMIPF